MAAAKASLPLLALVAVLLVWQLAPLPEYILSPLEIGRHFVQALGTAELYENIWASLARSLPGFAIGSFVGAALGLAAGTARWFIGASRVLYPCPAPPPCAISSASAAELTNAPAPARGALATIEIPFSDHARGHR